MSTKLAKQQTKTLATAPTLDLEADSKLGQEQMSQKDFAIPNLTILQDLSPQTKKQRPEFIKGAEVGQICDPVAGEIFDGEKGIIIIPVHYRRAHIEWKPNRGGFVKDHGLDETMLNRCVRTDDGKNVLPGGNIINTTAEYFVLMVKEDGTTSPYVLRMSGSQLKKSRRWNTMINQLRVPSKDGGTFNPAMFYRTYLLASVPESNDKGSWMGWKISADKNVLELEGGANIYVAAREFHKQIKDGLVVAQAPTDHDGGTATPEDDSAAM